MTRTRTPKTDIAYYQLPGVDDRRGPSIVAAASVYSSRRLDRAYPAPRNLQEAKRWQEEAWSLYDEIGEMWFGVNWVANSMSQVRLIAAVPSPSGPETVEDGLVAELVAGFAGGVTQQMQVLQRAGLHLATVGETWIIGRETDPSTAGQDEVRPYSSEEVTYQTGRWAVDDGSGKIELGEDDLIIRSWRPHPRRWQWPDTSVRPTLPVARELRALTQYVSAQCDSRLAGAGLLLIPDSIEFPSSATADAADGEDPFTLALIDVVSTAIRDRSSAASLVPAVVRGPAEAISQVKHLRLDTPLDGQAKELRDEAIRRIALSLDIPPEVLKGLADANHWGAWAISEEAIKHTIAPLAAMICHSLTVGWLRPALEEAGVTNPGDYMVWFDTSPLELRPDRSRPAVELYDRAELSAEALRRENGFTQADAPSDEERLRILIAQAMRANPSALPELASLLGISLPAVAGSPPAGGGDDQVGEEGVRELPEQPADQTPPSQAEPPVRAASAVSDCELRTYSLAVIRALEMCGKRLLTRSRRSEAANVPPWELHVKYAYDRDPDLLLAGAWEPLRAAVGEPRYQQIRPILDTYVRRLLNTRQPHSDDTLRQALDAALTPGELTHA